jgi:hypothetical protein
MLRKRKTIKITDSSWDAVDFKQLSGKTIHYIIVEPLGALYSDGQKYNIKVLIKPFGESVDSAPEFDDKSIILSLPVQATIDTNGGGFVHSGREDIKMYNYKIPSDRVLWCALQNELGVDAQFGFVVIYS